MRARIQYEPEQQAATHGRPPTPRPRARSPARPPPRYIEQDSKFQKNSRALEQFRDKYRIRRGIDGRVQLKSSTGEWWAALGRWAGRMAWALARG